jgi:hypothetical protein
MSAWSGAGRSRKGAAHLEAVECVKEWTRRRFALAAEEIVVLTELATRLPGFPPLQTAVTFWTRDNIRHHFTVFKAVEEVAEGDLPPAWLKDSIALSGGIDCPCC